MGVATIGDAAIPKNPVICKLQLFAIVLLIGLAVLTIQARCSQTPNTHSLSFFEPLHIVPHLGDHPYDLVPTHTNTNTININIYTLFRAQTNMSDSIIDLGQTLIPH